MTTVGLPEIYFLAFLLFSGNQDKIKEVIAKTARHRIMWRAGIFTLNAKLAAMAPIVIPVAKSWKVMFEMVC